MELKRIGLNPFEIAFDKENPRDENQKEIENDPQFKKLKEHIKQYGLYNPIVVKKEKCDKKEYVLVDGERRLRVCQSLKIENIPVNLVEGNIDKRELAYQLHMLNKPWSMTVRVKSINQIVAALKGGGKEEADILNEVEELTKMPREQIRDILKVLRYPEEVIKTIEKKEQKRTYLIEAENNFIPLIKKEFPTIFKNYGEDKLREIIGEKLLSDKLGPTKSFRDLKDYITENLKRNGEIIEKSVNNFLKNKEIKIDQISKGVEEYTKKEIKRIVDITHTKKEIQKTDEEVVLRSIDLTAKLIAREKSLIENDIFDLIFRKLSGSIIEFERRFKTKIENERQLQNFVYSLLRCLFISIEFEDPAEKMCEKSTKPDFIIKDHKIILEMKYVRDKNHKAYEELSADYNKYVNNLYGQKIINYIYDPEKIITNPRQYEKDLNKAFPKALNYVG